ncbi:MAG: DUF63 family protein [Candidatus Aenigmarchaeota archaeon]|nr:DUF63 family protein [Candidatus Aenigmarchaeota archaeon]
MPFLEDYFINPLIYGTGYNPVNTIVYALIAVGVIFLLYKAIRRIKIKIDEKFCIGIAPYIIIGGLWRSLQDARVLDSIFFKTPFIYFIIIAITFVSLIVSRLLFKEKYYKSWLLIGTGILVFSLAFVKIVNPVGMALIIGISAAWMIGFFMLRKYNKKFNQLLTNLNFTALGVHIFDATSTFIAIAFFPYIEQHVVSGFVIGVLGPWSMYLLKIPIVLLALYIIDKDVKNEEWNTFLKLAVIVLGAGPGLRNFFSLGMMV